MSLLNSIQFGKGNPNFTWEVVEYIGDYDQQMINPCRNYSDALAYVVNNKSKSKGLLAIELWYREVDSKGELITGDAIIIGENLIEIREALKVYENN